MKSFTDEMLKISQAGLGQTVVNAGKGIASRLGGKGAALAIPATALTSILGWEHAKKMKQRYDIGKLVEESQNRG